MENPKNPLFTVVFKLFGFKLLTSIQHSQRGLYSGTYPHLTLSLCKLCFMHANFTNVYVGKIRVFMHHFADLFTPGGKLSPSNKIKRQKNKA